jgi:hypothetical protein
MARKLGELRLAVAGFLQRKPEDFLRGAGSDDEVDLLTLACNNARLWAERQIDFEKSKVAVDLPNVSLVDGADLGDAVLHSDGSTPVRVKKIRTPFLPLTGTSIFPVDLLTKKAWDNRIKARFEHIRPNSVTIIPTVTNLPYAVIQDGDLIFVAPPDSTTFPSGVVNVYLDVIQWLDDYTDVDQTDFLLDFAFDWLMYRAIYELNFFLKEDERVSLSTKLIGDAWNAVVKWNQELVEANTDDANLD